MNAVKTELLGLGEEAHRRVASRIEDMSDDEYLWEPVPDCWTIRPGGDGRFHGEWGLVFDEVPPVTTIAWRITHAIDMFSGDRCATYIGVTPDPDDIFADGAPATASSARDLFDRAYQRWARYVTATDDDRIYDKQGSVAGPFADTTRMAFILHIVDEVIHHGAEVGVLRDLYRAERQHNPLVSALLRGDRAEVDTLRSGDPGAIDRIRGERPSLVLEAAATARWDAIPYLVELGFAVEGTGGRTALHHAAAEGRIDLIHLLVDHGADLTVRDPIYNATPLEWAEYFSRKDAADVLRTKTT